MFGVRRAAGGELALLRRLRNAGGALSPHSSLRHARRLLLLLLPAVAACGPEAGEASDPELRAALGLDDSVVIHRVGLGGEGPGERIDPPLLEVEVGDVVQFVPTDRRVRVVVFGGERLGDTRRAFLDRTRQEGSPPLMDEGSRFVVTFEGAPTGPYPFTSTAHGASASGVILVRPPDELAR